VLEFHETWNENHATSSIPNTYILVPTISNNTNMADVRICDAWATLDSRGLGRWHICI